MKYLPKGGDGYNPPPTTSPTTTMTASTTSTTDSSRPTGDPFFGKGYLKIDTGGCLISTGKWFTSGTCATYTAAPFGSGFTLTSSKGNCAIASGVFTCGRTVLGDVFSVSLCGSLTHRTSFSDQFEISQATDSLSHLETIPASMPTQFHAVGLNNLCIPPVIPLSSKSCSRKLRVCYVNYKNVYSLLTIFGSVIPSYMPSHCARLSMSGSHLRRDWCSLSSWPTRPYFV